MHFITKSEYFAALDDELTCARLDGTIRATVDLKHVQDAWVLYALRNASGLRIAEIGGGHCRALRAIAGHNELWNIDDFGQDGTTPRKRNLPKEPPFKIVFDKLGSFNAELPSDYFDVIASISVIEHVPEEAAHRFWSDHVRIMKPDGRALHAIDFYLNDECNMGVERRISHLLKVWNEVGLEQVETAEIERPAVFRCDMASNPDLGMHYWNKISPALKHRRSRAQSVSLCVVLKKA